MEITAVQFLLIVLLGIKGFSGFALTPCLLMLQKAECGVNTETLWSSVLSNAVTSASCDNLNDILSNADNYRNNRIDYWNNETPVKIRMTFLNDFGDDLLWIEFNTESSGMPLQDWHRNDKILASSLKIHSHQVNIMMTVNYDAYVQDIETNYNSYAWYAIFKGLSGSSLAQFPKFFLTGTNSSSPLKQEFTVGTYQGCYSFSSYNDLGVNVVSPRKCLETCSRNSQFSSYLLGENRKCYCGNFVSNLVQNEDQCQQCTGYPLYRCGKQSNVFGFYDMTDTGNKLYDPSGNMESTAIHRVSLDFSVDLAQTVDLNTLSSYPVYTTALEVSTASGVIIDYYLNYSTSYSCHISDMDIVRNSATTQRIFKSGQKEIFPVLPAHCLMIIPTTRVSLKAYVTIYAANNSGFIEAPYMALEGFYKTEETASSTTSSTALQSKTGSITSTKPSSTEPLLTSTTPQTTSLTSQKTLSTTLSTSTFIATSSLSSDSAPEIHTVSTSCFECSCKFIFNKDHEITPELQKKLEEIKVNLTLPRKALSSYIRTITSAPDKRPTAQSLGYTGMILLLLSVSFIVILDVTNLTIFKSTR